MGACSGGDLLPFGELADRRLRYARVIGDLRRVHEAVGQVARFGCRGVSRPPYLRPGILAAFGISIRYFRVRRERVAWHLEDVAFHGMTLPPLVLHLAPSGRKKAQGVASLGWASRDVPVGRHARKAARGFRPR